MSTGIISLSAEVLANICSFLKGADILQLRKVSKLSNDNVSSIVGYCKFIVSQINVSSMANNNKTKFSFGFGNPRHFFLWKICIVPTALNFSGITQETKTFMGYTLKHQMHMQLSLGEARSLFKNTHYLFQKVKFSEMRIEGDNLFEPEILSILSKFIEGKCIELVVFSHNVSDSKFLPWLEMFENSKADIRHVVHWYLKLEKDTLTRLANIAEVIHINRMKSKNPRSFVVSIIQEMLTRKCNNVHFGDNTRLLTSLDVELLLQFCNHLDKQVTISLPVIRVDVNTTVGQYRSETGLGEYHVYINIGHVEIFRGWDED